MKHAINYAVYPTQGIEIGRSNFAQYVKRHIEYLIAAQNPAYSSIISETQSLHHAMFVTLTTREQNFYQRISLTNNVRTIKKAFNSKIDDLEEAIAFKFHKNSAVYLEVFSHGVTPYKEATLSDTIIKMELAISFAEKYKNDIGEPIKNDLTAIRLSFETEAAAQGAARGEVKNVIPDFDEKRREMDKQLLKNICTIIIANIDNPTAVASFFDEYLIFPKFTKKEEGLPYILKLVANTHAVADISFSVDDTLLITNTGTISIFYYGAPTANTPIPAILTEILPGEEKEVPAITLGAPNNKFLIFVNKDLLTEAEAEIVLI